MLSVLTLLARCLFHRQLLLFRQLSLPFLFPFTVYSPIFSRYFLSLVLQEIIDNIITLNIIRFYYR